MSCQLTIYDKVECQYLSYIAQYIDNESDADKIGMYALKRTHSERVVKIASTIVQNENIDSQTAIICRVAALLHDIGRFEQVKQYGTFDDNKSIDHGDLGHDILAKSAILEHFSEQNKQAILFAVKYHNKRHISDYPNKLARIVTTVTRDADRIDVYKVLYDSALSSEGNHKTNRHAQTIDDETVTDSVLKQFLNRESINIKEITKDVDMCVVRLGWIFDMNYKISTLMLIESIEYQYCLNQLPINATTNIIKNTITQYLNNFK